MSLNEGGQVSDPADFQSFFLVTKANSQSADSEHLAREKPQFTLSYAHWKLDLFDNHVHCARIQSTFMMIRNALRGKHGIMWEQLRGV